MRSGSWWPNSRTSSERPPGHLPTGQAVALRRVIFRLYALLKVHLAEEQLYLGIIEQGVSADGAEALAAAMEHAGTTEF